MCLSQDSIDHSALKNARKRQCRQNSESGSAASWHKRGSAAMHHKAATPPTYISGSAASSSIFFSSHSRSTYGQTEFRKDKYI